VAYIVVCFAGGSALEYPAGCSWTADSAADPYPSRTGGIATNAPSACVPATNPGGPLACDDRWGGTLSYTFPATTGKTYQASVIAYIRALGRVLAELEKV
jgi:hypothetical protein